MKKDDDEEKIIQICPDDYDHIILISDDEIMYHATRDLVATNATREQVATGQSIQLRRSSFTGKDVIVETRREWLNVDDEKEYRRKWGMAIKIVAENLMTFGEKLISDNSRIGKDDRP